MKIGFIGLGVMGGPMAANLIRQGNHTVQVFDSVAAKMEPLCDQGGIPAGSIKALAEKADLVMTSLPGPKQITAVALEEGMLNSMPRGAGWIDLSTNNLSTCQQLLSVANEKGIEYLDAPVSGGDEGARAGSLTVLVGGNKSVHDRFLPILKSIGQHIRYLGLHGAGYSAKIAQVVLCYLHSLALSEALMLGVKGGVDRQQMLSIIQNSTGKSYVADRYGPPILAGDYDPSFSLGLALKDMNLAIEMAEDLDIELPLCRLTTETYRKAVDEYGFDANHLKAVRLLEEKNQLFLQT
ncbi:MAG: NAD(P)-dependent oxidoreductase [Acidiferrobacterales bacterium]|nr:NAD(P)-dependent oxidoreductase [Acidiferrobacterales bacterium]